MLCAEEHMMWTPPAFTTNEQIWWWRERFYGSVDILTSVFVIMYERITCSVAFSSDQALHLTLKRKKCLMKREGGMIVCCLEDGLNIKKFLVYQRRGDGVWNHQSLKHHSPSDVDLHLHPLWVFSIYTFHHLVLLHNFSLVSVVCHLVLLNSWTADSVLPANVIMSTNKIKQKR